MGENRLNIIETNRNNQNSNFSKTSYAGGKARRLETQAYFDRLWLTDPEHLDPLRNCMEMERLERTFQLIKEHMALQDKWAVDLGCGSGELAAKLHRAKARVTAVDISSNALKILKERHGPEIEAIQDYAPLTILRDDTYDLVVCTELIAYLHADEYRLLFSELTRLVKPDGYIVCSTSLDIDSVDALQRFADMAETEIQIDKWAFGWHRCYIRIKDFFTAPSRFVRASKDAEYRKRELKNRYSLSLWWFRMNSTMIPASIWFLVQYIFSPFVHFLKKNPSFLLYLEKACKFIWSESGISQAIFIGKRRTLLEKLPADEIPLEIKHKKQLWE